MKLSSFIKINPADSVVVCLRPMKKGETIEVDGKSITLLQDTPAGHKVLINDAPEGTNIIKYGYPIGHAKQDLKQGEWVNENNLKTNLAGTLEYTYNPVEEQLCIAQENRTFQGYVRKNGEVGVRNEIWVVPTVGCVNGVAEKLVELLKKETGCEGIDAIHAWHHNFGCSQLSGDHENTRKVLRDICLHPNAGAVLVLSLGCENNQPDAFMEMLGDYDKDRIKLLVTQKVEGDELEEGMKILRDLYQKAKEDKREEVPVSKLRIGLKCGGSDGFSGITANPLVGEFSDWLVAQGGTSILTEVPEMFGAETILMNRCENKELFDKTVHLINDFKEYFLSHGGREPIPRQQGGRHLYLGGQGFGLHPEVRTCPSERRIAIWRPLGDNRFEPPLRPRQRPRGSNGLGIGRLPTRALHHRTRHAIRHLRTYDEDFHQLQLGEEQAKLDRLQRRRVGRGHRDERPRAQVYRQDYRRGEWRGSSQRVQRLS